jgi:hypothetical protein
MVRSIGEVAALIRSTLTQAVFGAYEGEVLVRITGVRIDQVIDSQTPPV